jgi:cyclic beta-1,2-glucan synthetase
MSERALVRARLQEPTPCIQSLSNGRYTTILTQAGAGGSLFEGQAITRWQPDPTEDGDGFFIYLKDLDSGEVWSAGHQPLGRSPQDYHAVFHPGAVEITRAEHGIEICLEVCVAADADLELRRCRLHNASGRPRRIQLTSYVEPALTYPQADAAHPAFSKLFVQTEYLPEQGLLVARRRARSAGERTLSAAHWLIPQATGTGEGEFETDRARFIGRGRDLARPAALEGDLSRTQGNVLDPVLSLRRVLELAPGETATLSLALAAAYDPKRLLELAERHRDAASVEETFRGAARLARRRLERLDIDKREARAIQALGGALWYGDPRLRAPQAVLRHNPGPPADPSSLGLREDLPLVLVYLTHEDQIALVRTLLKAQALWGEQGLAVTLFVLVNGSLAADPGLAQALRDASAPGGRAALVLRSGKEVGEADQIALQCAARIVLYGALPDLEPPAGDPPSPPAPLYAPALERDPHSGPVETEALLFDNGLGGFSQDGREYRIRVSPTRSRLPPQPWTNVIANPSAGCVVSERGSIFTWAGNSREHRLTPWYNDPVRDPCGEALYIRDEDTGLFWSPTPGPTPDAHPYTVHHGWGYTRFRHTGQGLEQELSVFVPRHDPLRIARLRLRNLDVRPRRLSVFSYQRLVLGALPAETAPFVITAYEPRSRALLARNPYGGEFAARVAFGAAVTPQGREAVHYSADRQAFIGRNARAARPRALIHTRELDGRCGAGLDPCLAFQVHVELAPGEEWACSFLLGEGEDREAALDLVARYRDPAAIERAFDEVRRFWEHTLSGVRIETPAPAIDLMVNGWLGYQNLACRIWARSACYQSGGAYGFRDQLQDAAALIPLQPALAREQILRHAAHQFVEGDVLHWWHPPGGRGIRTRFSDDLLWLPYVTAHYVRTTGDRALLGEPAGFLRARALEPGEDEAYLAPVDSGETADLYEHCCRALDRGLTRGPHGLPLMGSGDWNDGMNRVGREGRGESVWLGFFIYHILARFLPLCEVRGDRARAGRYRAYQSSLNEALNEAGWDGAWYRRAYYDDGTPLGSAKNQECRIDAIAQAWAVISGAAPQERAQSALDALEKYLVDEDKGIIRLLTPAFDRTGHDPGYIKGYLPGVRENGGQYTHGALWAIKALAEAGRHARAARLLEMLSPVRHADSPDAVTVYQVEPYVIAADVYGVAPHEGRGGWTWYTGSAGWMYRIALESVLGFTIEDGDTLVLRPRIPGHWDGYRLRYRLPESDTVYAISVRNEADDASSVASASVDGAPVPVADGAARIALVDDGTEHTVEIILRIPGIPGTVY